MESVNIAIRHGDAKSLGSSFTQLLYQERYLQRRDGSAFEHCAKRQYAPM